MKIKYEFVTGEKLEIEVEDNIGEIVVELEVMQSRRNRTETRRHGYVKAKTGNQTAKVTYDGWYSEVYLPVPKADEENEEGQG